MAVAVEATGEAAVTTARPRLRAKVKDQAKPEEKPPQQQVDDPVKKDPKPKAAKNSSIHHPPYIQMVVEAISFLKERTGSSQRAIAKYLEDKYSSGLPATFKRMLSIQLKSLSNSGKITKVKNSFKLPATSKSTSSSSRRPAIKAAKAASPARKIAVKAAPGVKVKRAIKPASQSSTRALKSGPKAAPKSRGGAVRSSTRSSSKSKATAPAAAATIRKRKITTPSKAKKAVTPAKRARRVAA